MTSRRHFIRSTALGTLGLITLEYSAVAQIQARRFDQISDILKRITPPAFPDRRYSITDFGAIGNGSADALPAVREAVRVCNEAGGGMVVVPAGRWLMMGPIHLKSNVNLHVAEGAVVAFASREDLYLPPVLSRWEGTELYNYSPLIYCYQSNNVAITGKGTIDGRASENFAKWKPRQKMDQELLRKMGDDAVPVHQRVFGEEHWLRPPMIQFFGCRNVLVQDLTLIDSPFWMIHPVYCQNVIVQGIHADSHNANNDGVDPDSSVDVLIENCVFSTGDDAVAVKSGRDRDGWRVAQPAENIVVRNCRMSSRANGLCIGSEISGGVRNVFMENCVVGEVESAIYFKSNRDRGGIVENVFVRGVQVEKAEALVRFTNNYHSHRGGRHDSVFRNFNISEVKCMEASIAIDAEGLPETPLTDIHIKKMTVAAAGKPNVIRYTERFSLEDVNINLRE